MTNVRQWFDGLEDWQKKALCLGAEEDEPTDKCTAVVFVLALLKANSTSPRIKELETQWNITPNDFEEFSASDVPIEFGRIEQSFEELEGLKKNYRN